MEDRIKVTLEGGVADVKLTRADKMNALDDAMFEALVATGERLKTTPGVRATSNLFSSSAITPLPPKWPTAGRRITNRWDCL